jgi:methyl coenzyme M reductase subunit D
MLSARTSVPAHRAVQLLILALIVVAGQDLPRNAAYGPRIGLEVSRRR